MAVAAFKSTTRRQWDIRGVELETSPLSGDTSRSMNQSPLRRSVSRNLSPSRRSVSRNPSPTRRSVSRAPSPTRRSRGTSRNPSPTRRSVSKAPSPTRGRRGVSRNPSPTRRSVSKAPSPTRGRRGQSRNPSPSRRAVSRQPSPSRRAEWRAPSPTRGRRDVSRGPSPTRGRRAVSRGPSPTRGRRGASRGPSPTRGRRGVSRGPSPSRQQVSPATPATPGGRTVSRPTSPQRQPTSKLTGRLLRRTQSSADMALSQFLSDASVVSGSPPEIVTRQSSIRQRGSPRALPSDSESEAEPRYTRRLDRSFSSRRDSSDNESVQSSRSSSRRTGGQRAGALRRSIISNPHRSVNSHEISDTATPVYYQKSKPEDHHKDEGEVQGEKTIEEKTIQEVHTATVVQTLCYNCLYDVSATTDPPPDAVSPMGAVKMKVLGTSREAPPGDVDFVALYTARCAEVRQAVSDARVELENVKEEELRSAIEEKLELSEKKVSELWSQYATEERRCLHLVKSVKDIKDGSGTLEADLDEPGMEVALPAEKDLKQHQHRYPMDDMDEADFIRQSLDDEAARYFEECAIIANFDANVADDISLSSSRISDGETTVNDDPRPSRRQSSDSPDVMSVRKKQITPLGDEGMLLPWLDWEPEVDLGRKERLEKAVCDFREWKSAWARKSVEWGRSSNRERGQDEGAVNVDEFLFERTRLQPRIGHGRMLVCGGKR